MKREQRTQHKAEATKDSGWFTIYRYDNKTGGYRDVRVYVPTKEEDE